MKKKIAAILAATALCFGATSALALPKAAEDSDSPVTIGADIERPKTKKPAASVKAAKTSKGNKAVKSTKPAQRRKTARVKA